MHSLGIFQVFFNGHKLKVEYAGIGVGNVGWRCSASSCPAEGALGGIDHLIYI